MNFDFNVYSSLLLPAVIEGLLFFILLLVRGVKNERLSDKLLAFLILCITMIVSSWMLGFAGWYDSHNWQATFMFYFPLSSITAVGPLFYVYFLSLTNNNFKLNKKALFHFIIPAIFILIYLVKFVFDVIFKHLIEGNPLPEHFGTKGTSVDIGSDFELIAGYLSLIFYIWLTFKTFRHYRRYIYDNFSQQENINFTWLWRLLIIFAIGISIKTAFSVFGNFIGSLSYVQLWYSFLILSFVIYYLSIEGYNVDFTKIKKLDFQLKRPSAENLPEPEINNPDNKSEIAEFMREKKPYLQPELSLNELAIMLGKNRSELSKSINDLFGQNFNDFVNLYRVDEVKKLLAENKQKHLNLLGIALECGFNSKATFNRSFKKLTGITPKQYISSLKS